MRWLCFRRLPTHLLLLIIQRARRSATFNPRCSLPRALAGREKANMQEIYLKNSAGLDLFCRYWKPVSSEPRAVVFLAHGFGEHIGYYEELAACLLKESFYVFAHDHVGHGRSKGSRAYVNSVDDYVKDIVIHFDKINKEINETIPRFIVGHSMGGTIAIKAAMHHPQMFRGVVLVAPAVIVSPELATPVKVFLAKLVSRIAPQFPVAAIDWNSVTRNKKMVEKYTKDNLCNQERVKAKWAVAMYYALQEIHNNLTNIEWPYYLLHGSADAITDISGSKLLHNCSSSKDKQFKIYEEASHNLLQELDDIRASVCTEITNWISARLQPAAELESEHSEDKSERREEKTEGREEKTEGREEKTERREEKTERREEKTEGREEKTEDRGEKPKDREEKTEDREEKTEDREEKTERREEKTEGREEKTEDRKEKTEDREEKTERREEKTEGREEKTEDREEKTEDREEKPEDREEKTEDRKEKTEDREEKTEDREEKTEDREEKTNGREEKIQSRSNIKEGVAGASLVSTMPENISEKDLIDKEHAESEVDVTDVEPETGTSAVK